MHKSLQKESKECFFASRDVEAPNWDCLKTFWILKGFDSQMPDLRCFCFNRAGSGTHQVSLSIFRLFNHRKPPQILQNLDNYHSKNSKISINYAEFLLFSGWFNMELFQPLPQTPRSGSSRKPPRSSQVDLWGKASQEVNRSAWPWELSCLAWARWRRRNLKKKDEVNRLFLTFVWYTACVLVLAVVLMCLVFSWFGIHPQCPKKHKEVMKCFIIFGFVASYCFSLCLVADVFESLCNMEAFSIIFLVLFVLHTLVMCCYLLFTHS